MIIITGGPVHGKLDDVKLVTNRFKGGRMAALADELARKDHVMYITSKGSILPKDESVEIIYHDGFFDYKDIVLSNAPNADAVILGAAVCNLIPSKPWEGKFPSHNYNPGDEIDIKFMIAPRVIDEVKLVAPKTKLFGFKLLSGVNPNELIAAAYESVLASKAVCIFANDAKELDKKYAVTKEHAVINLQPNELATFIWNAIQNEYYTTHSTKVGYELEKLDTEVQAAIIKLESLVKLPSVFRKVGAYSFGTCAVRCGNSNSFVTTSRGKETGEEFAFVKEVSHDSLKVETVTTELFHKKATLNAPLLSWIFETTNTSAIIHIHCRPEDIDYDILKEYVEPNGYWEEFEYSFPGTKVDSIRTISSNFYIKNHGVYILIK